ncbi:MAG: PP2C family serine/threonine-protein phosphatase, partial [Fusobacteriaceae bacterium]
ISHKKNALPCQDKTYSLAKNNVNVIALGDGAGSCKYSHFGAEIATKEVCNIMCDDFERLFNLNNEDLTKKIMGSCILAIKKNYEEFNLNEFSSTLLFVAVKGNHYIVGHMGDGVIGYKKDDKVEVLSKPQNGEYINSTFFITNTNAIDKFNIVRGNLNDITGFILMSDGVSDSLYDRKKQSLSNAADTMLEWLENNSEEEVKSALEVNFKNLLLNKTTDDCSVALMKYKEEKVDENVKAYYKKSWLEQCFSLIFLPARIISKKIKRK